MSVRGAKAGDAARLAELSGQLGYPATAAEMGDRLAVLLARPGAHAVFVAEQPDGSVRGWIHVAVRELLEYAPLGEILGLVVDGAARRGGVGRALVEAAERWVRDQGLGDIMVRSNAARAESHPFYERLGYARIKSQHVYRKPLER